MVIRIAAILLLLGSCAFAGSPIAIPNLQKESDLIVVGTLQSVSPDGSGGLNVNLLPSIFLKGGATGAFIQAGFPPSARMLASNEAGFVHVNDEPLGLWFLKSLGAGEYKVVPVAGGEYTWSDAFLPMPPGWSPAANGSLVQNLLSALVAHYQSLAQPSLSEDYRLIGSLKGSDPSDGLMVADQLIASPVSQEIVVGLAAAIQLGSDSALAQLAQQAETLQSNGDFHLIIEALSADYQPHGLSSIGPLTGLAALHSGIPGLDLAVVRAIGRIGDTQYTPAGGAGPAAPPGTGTAVQQTLPALVGLLDSQDPNAQLAAAWLLAQFTVLADGSGDIVQGGSPSHPYQSDETIKYMPWKGSDVPVAVYVSFWKSWWAKNQAKLAVAAPAQ